jgi:hypothetical protein
MDPDGGALSPHALHRRLRRSERSLRNHLRSIVADATFVGAVRGAPAAFELPLFANQRCGAWYAPDADGAAYFKSTDGHAGTWAFSSTRLNLHFAAAAAASRGALLVDATRAGKRFPDALTRTVPLWAAVINATLGVGGGSAVGAPAGAVHVCCPPWIPGSERAQVEARAAAFAGSLPEGTRTAILSQLRGRVTAPLVPAWLCPQPTDASGFVSRASSDGDFEGDDDGADTAYEFVVCDCVSRRLVPGDGAPVSVSRFLSAGGGAPTGGADGDASQPPPPFIPLMCVSASRVVPDAGDEVSAHAGWTYIQGAGDDAESWARGLSPSLLWGPDGARALLPLLRGGSGGGNGDGANSNDADAALQVAVDALVLLQRTRGLGTDAAALASAGDGDDSGVSSCTAEDAAAALLASLRLPLGLPQCVSVWLPPAPLAAPLSPAVVATLRQQFTNADGGGTHCHVLLLTPLLETDGDTTAAATAGAGDPPPPPPSSPACTLLAVPADKRAARRADGGRVWQATLLPAVEAAVAWACADAGTANAGCRLAVLPSTPELAPHAVLVAAVAAVYQQRLHAGGSRGTAISTPMALSSAQTTDDIAPAAIPVTKAGLRGLLAQLQAAAAVPSVPRELQQQLNARFLSPGREGSAGPA